MAQCAFGLVDLPLADTHVGQAFPAVLRCWRCRSAGFRITASHCRRKVIGYGVGGVPEWLKGTGCKPVGLAYVGSNPTPSTNPPVRSDGQSGRCFGAAGCRCIGGPADRWLPRRNGALGARRV